MSFDFWLGVIAGAFGSYVVAFLFVAFLAKSCKAWPTRIGDDDSEYD